jgi:hypothetical protein
MCQESWNRYETWILILNPSNLKSPLMEGPEKKNIRRLFYGENIIASFYLSIINYQGLRTTSEKW